MRTSAQRLTQSDRYFQRHVTPRFRLSSEGVYLLAPSQGPEPPEEFWICSPLNVRADTRNHQHQEWGKLLEFPDKDGNQHRYLMPMSALSGDGRECCAQLLSQGLRIAP